MNKIPIFIFLLFSSWICAQNEVKICEDKAILIGEKLTLYNEQLESVEDVSDWNHALVEIIEVAENWTQASNDICDNYKWVKVRNGDKTGLIKGNFVYKLEDSKQVYKANATSPKLKIYTTSNFKTGIENEEGLTYCDADQPMVIEDPVNHFFGLVEMVKPNESNNSTFQVNYPYFQLRSDEGRYDFVDNLSNSGNLSTLVINRKLQEGSVNFEMLLIYQNGKYIAEYLRKGNLEYSFD